MNNEQTIITDNIAYLKQAVALLEHIDKSVFTHSNPPLYTGGVGPHLRHCLDHYVSLLGGIEQGKVDYDSRDRDERLETDPDYAMSFIRGLIEQLESLAQVDMALPLKVKMDCGSPDERPWSDGSLKRELQFMISHTVHHYALISMILKDQGVPVPEEFGVAPSTLKYRCTHA